MYYFYLVIKKDIRHVFVVTHALYFCRLVLMDTHECVDQCGNSCHNGNDVKDFRRVGEEAPIVPIVRSKITKNTVTRINGDLFHCHKEGIPVVYECCHERRQESYQFVPAYELKRGHNGLQFVCHCFFLQ